MKKVLKNVSVIVLMLIIGAIIALVHIAPKGYQV